MKSAIKSKVNALLYFKQSVIPHRIRNKKAEQKYLKKHGKEQVIYRRALPDERGDSEPYPVCSAGMGTFAQFGIGIGTYFLQLLMLSLITFICGLIMLPAVAKYSSSKYGISTNINPFLSISAACDESDSYEVQVDGCEGFDDCTNGVAMLDYREDCTLPFDAALADLFMSIVFFLLIVASKYLEGRLEEELDEAVQTPQDYSVVVEDPPPDADDPDEWHEYFSEYGKVKLVTIIRRNRSLEDTVTSMHTLLIKIQELSQTVTEEDDQLKEKIIIHEQKVKELEDTLKSESKRQFTISKVYVTFNRERHQRRCLKENEVPDLYAWLDISVKKDRRKFRGEQVLNIREPPEPDSVNWDNIGMKTWMWLLRRVLSSFLSIAVFAGLYFLVVAVYAVSPLLLSVLIGVIDSVLPMLFERLTHLSAPLSEGEKQANMQVQLFMARLLLSTVFPYVTADWHQAVSGAFIQQLLITQISASFMTPIMQLLDIAGLFQRHVTGPLFAQTQGELNRAFGGSNWVLAEKYTANAKVLFLALFYTILNPIGLYIATLAFLFVFFVDRFLLLRRWKPVCMMDSQIAQRLRQQAFLAVAAHMYITLRYIYSWPMDQVAVKDNGELRHVDKYPYFWVPFAPPVQSWHSQAQKDMLIPYCVGFYLVFSVAAYIWVVAPLVHFIRSAFFYTLDIVGDAQGLAFNTIERIVAYVPLIQHKTEQYICAHIEDVPPKNMPSLLRAVPGDRDNLCEYVPMEVRPKVLSVVKFYRGSDDVDPESDEKHNDDIKKVGNDNTHAVGSGKGGADNNSFPLSKIELTPQIEEQKGSNNTGRKTSSRKAYNAIAPASNDSVRLVSELDDFADLEQDSYVKVRPEQSSLNGKSDISISVQIQHSSAAGLPQRLPPIQQSSTQSSTKEVGKEVEKEVEKEGHDAQLRAQIRVKRTPRSYQQAAAAIEKYKMSQLPL